MTSNEWLQQLCSTSWQGGILALLALTLIFCFGKYMSSGARYFLLLVVLLRFALPFAPDSGMSVFGLPQRFFPVQKTSSQTEMSVKTGEQIFLHETRNPERNIADISITNAAFSKAEIQTRNVRWFHERFWEKLFAGIWCGGVLVFTLRLLWRQTCFYIRRQSWFPATKSELRLLLENCRRQAGLRRKVKLYLTSENICAASFGIFRAKIVLSENLVENCSASEIRFVLLHEILHHKRLDPVVHFLSQCLQVLHWPNPLLWILVRQLDSERELAVDQDVLRRCGTQNAPMYGNTVLKAVRLSRHPLRLPLTLNFQSRNHFLERRIKMIIKPQNMTQIRFLLNVLLVSVFAITSLTDAQTQEHSPEIPLQKVENETDNTVKQEEPEFLELFGTVKDENGNPIEDAEIGFVTSRSMPFKDTAFLEKTKTDSQGKFCLHLSNDINAKSIYAFKTGYTPAFTNGKKQEIPSRDSLASLERLSDEVSYDLVLEKAQTVNVKIVNEKGEPLENVPVCKAWDDNAIDFLSPSWRRKTDAQGIAVFDCVPCSATLIRFQAGGVLLPSGDGSTKCYLSQRKIWNADKNSDGNQTLTITLSEGAAVCGRVEMRDGSEASQSWISIRTSRGSHIMTSSDENGTFSLPFFEKHSSINIGIESQHGAAPGVFFFDVGDGSEMKQLDFVLDKGVRLHGKVFDSQGKAIRAGISIDELSPTPVPEHLIKDSYGFSRGMEAINRIMVQSFPKSTSSKSTSEEYEYILPPGQFKVYPSIHRSNPQILTVDGTEGEIRLDFHCD